MKIEDIDKNFVASKLSNLGDLEVHYYDVRKKPFSVEGFGWLDKYPEFHRLPLGLTKDEVNEGALYLATNTAGGAVRFRTDSRVIALRAELVNSADMNHMPRLGSAGFDLYHGAGTNKLFFSSAPPERDQKILELVMVNFGANEETPKLYDWTLNMPLYGGVGKLEIGILPGSKLEAPTPHAIHDPVLFYGSSITQGGCASRPGNAYTSMLCRAVDAAQINLGFSGSGRGEPKVAELIAELKLSCFVMDYDHNAPTAEHLAATHEPFFRTIRKKHPTLPVIFLSKCDTWTPAERLQKQEYADQQNKRRDIVYKTYENALSAGDKNVYFIDGAELFGGKDRTECTVDGCHPNDLGFYRMAQTVLPVLKKALGIR